MARLYKKRSDYWKKFDSVGTNDLSSLTRPQNESDSAPMMIGESFYQSVEASRLNNSSGRSTSRTNNAATKPINDRFANIRSGLLPFEYSSDYVSARDTFELCQRAYFNVPALRSTVDLLADLANAPIYLEGGTAKSKKFISAWFKRINIEALKAQYFVECYRSSNVFLYRLDGTLKSTNPAKLIESYGSSVLGKKIPIKYMVLNPSDIAAKGGLYFAGYEYVKILTPFEIARLSNPTNEHDKELLSSLPPEAQMKIKGRKTVAAEEIFITLDPNKLSPIFCKKQDYEPLAIPYIFSVLDDINKKMELKKIDQAISRTIENVILLITMGSEPDKGGINHANVKATQEIFQNKSVGRVLVSDYTTKADFIIPDLRKVVGPEKYEILNKDIQDGLQNMLIGDSKYADGEMKMKIFMERLREPREAFLREFLQKEVNNVCKSVGLQSPPKVKFQQAEGSEYLEDKKIIIRMIELGVLTPEQGLKAINIGELPSHEELDSAQKEFKEKRKEGFYMPIVNSLNIYTGEEGEGKADKDAPSSVSENTTENSGIETSKKKKKDGNGNGLSPSGGRPMGTSNASKDKFSRKGIIEVNNRIHLFELKAFAKFAEKFGLDEVEGSKKELVSQTCESIIVAKDEDEWDQCLASAVEDFSSIMDLGIKPEILEIGAKHQLSDFASAILYHSLKNNV